MSPDQITLVRSTWPIVASNADGFTTRFYEQLLAIDNSAARLFGGVELEAQRKKLAQSLGVIVKALDDQIHSCPRWQGWVSGTAVTE